MTRTDYWTRKAFLFAAATVLVTSSPAMADSGKDKSHGKSEARHEMEYHNSNEHDGGNMTIIRIGDDDRMVLRGYMDEEYKTNCPPGLAKKHNGCLPPGLAKKSYEIGHSLPDDIKYEPVPRIILERLHPAPNGYQYVKVDTDVLLIGEASKKVIDAVTLLSGVGKQ
ncbi:MAG: hypothetical protein KDJ26_00630 [Alphaproteobacteria bacterium]|nr:hypothetical protein [Alphaproteobacteria bacterium]MCB1550482.1 hypothetical protein [Alphaproteobacteria bacterium]MCB9985977.1 hypothetical protein [Micavibrio sp.]HPQ50773.1 hypothetical protein [Alphaproteobacteria bacterium]HRK96868.1 hypothetical protein [Alphaproteobacteria bacterium]